jgi:hypothetical protein
MRKATPTYNMDIQILQPSLLRILAVLILSYSLAKTIYRVYFHPLRSFPGPMLASIMDWNKFYYNWYLGGIHSLKIKQWHAQYGPIIRIAPNELHFSDALAYKAIYTDPELAKNLHSTNS